MNKEKLFSVTDFEVTHFKGSGPGGQSRNKNATAVRIAHKASGARGESQELKSQAQNKKRAFNRLVNSKEFQRRLRIRAAEAMGQETIEEKVEKDLQPKNLKVETKEEGKWVEDENDMEIPS